ncbi:MAG: glycoside hydrolase family 13 protein, partial [Acidimicrobiia bacterium]|nr:glycoside hydrolase family 13 protein [Acidimicrobiia bacterium]
MAGTYPWWRHAAVYQVYIRSFKDGNGDGTGDIAGLRSRLGYLRELGVDAIWINPWYVSPLNDGGYDVADYRQIDPRFGTLEEAEAFIADATTQGIRVLVDLVPNHTSSEHPWFQEALAAGPGSPERARYHFLRGKGPDGAEPPNDWQAVFGGSAWQRVADGEWYLHLFDVTQPDLNWANPEVREQMNDVIRFWLDRGAAGFRVDVAHSLAKDPTYPDVGEEPEVLLASTERTDHPFWDRDELHEIVREWRSVLEEYPGTMMVAEAWVADWERQARYVRPDEFHQSFDFHFLTSPWDVEAMRTAITKSLAGVGTVGAIPTWVLSNHDVVRHPTRYGLPQEIVAKDWLLDGDRSLLDEELGLQRARAATLLMLALPGSVYLYQGEELGLGEVHDLPPEVLDDPVWRRSGHTEKGRDGCRVPLPWEPSGESFGFGSDGSWLPQPAWFGPLAASAQSGVEGSTLELYRAALHLRREHFVNDEDLEWLDLGERVVAFRRGSGAGCVVNFGPEEVPLPDGDLLLASPPLNTPPRPPHPPAGGVFFG